MCGVDSIADNFYSFHQIVLNLLASKQAPIAGIFLGLGFLRAEYRLLPNSKIHKNFPKWYTVRPRYIATIGKREFWQYNKFGERQRSGFLPVTCRHSKMCMSYLVRKKKKISTLSIQVIP